MSPAASTDDPKEGLDLRPTGNAHLWVDGKQYKLRRPRGREFRRLRESWNEALEDLQEVQRANSAWVATIRERAEEREAAGEPWMTTEESDEDRARARAYNNLTEQRVLGWWMEVVEALGDDGALDRLVPKDGDGNRPDDAWEDMPPWLGSVPTASSIIDHWRTVPSLSGTS